MKKPNYFHRNILALLFMLVLGMNEAISQPPPPSFFTNVDDSGVPIHGLVAVALVLGAWIGARKIHKNKST